MSGALPTGDGADLSGLPLLRTARLQLQVLHPRYAALVAQYHQDNGAHLAPWEPPRPADFADTPFWAGRLEVAQDEARRQQSLRLWISEGHGAPTAVVGSINFTNVCRGPFQACNLGYALARTAQGQGWMTEALRAAIDFVFQQWHLHRIQANYIPENVRSGAVLERLGFVKEGRARDYLFINSRWSDHVLTSLTNPEPVSP